MTDQSIENPAFSVKARAPRRHGLQKDLKTGANRAEAMESGVDHDSRRRGVIQESAPR
jgi:hypothetical protein